MYELLFTAASTTPTGQRWSAQNWLRWLLFGDTSDLRGQYFGPIQPGPLTSNEPSAPLAHGKGFLSILFFRIAKAKSIRQYFVLRGNAGATQNYPHVPPK